MGLFDLVREEQEAKKKAEESAKKDTKDAVVEEVEKVEEAPKEADQQPAPEMCIRDSLNSDDYLQLGYLNQELASAKKDLENGNYEL